MHAKQRIPDISKLCVIGTLVGLYVGLLGFSLEGSACDVSTRVFSFLAESNVVNIGKRQHGIGLRHLCPATYVHST